MHLVKAFRVLALMVTHSGAYFVHKNGAGKCYQHLPTPDHKPTVGGGKPMAKPIILFPIGDSQDDDSSLSSQLDEATQMEEHYRDLLLFWKQRRQKLQAQIPNDSFQSLLEELFNDNSDST